MKERAKHCIVLLLALLLVVGAFSMCLNNISYNPNFSMLDVMTGATKKTHDNGTGGWGYSKADVAVSGENYTEETIVTEKSKYKVLANAPAMKDTDSIVLLSDKGNQDYQKAVKNLANHLEKQGYQVRIKACSETMMLSLVHAGHFDVFLMSEEGAK